MQRLTAAKFLVEHEFRGRLIIIGSAQRPVSIVEIETRLRVAQVHVRLVVGLYRADVAPIAQVLLGVAANPVRHEVVRVDRYAVD